MSRTPRSGTAGRPVTFRATPAEILQWAIAAEREKCATLSAWIVKTLNRRAAGVPGDPSGSAGVARERRSGASQGARRGRQT